MKPRVVVDPTPSQKWSVGRVGRARSAADDLGAAGRVEPGGPARAVGAERQTVTSGSPSGARLRSSPSRPEPRRRRMRGSRSAGACVAEHRIERRPRPQPPETKSPFVDVEQAFASALAATQTIASP